MTVHKTISKRYGAFCLHQVRDPETIKRILDDPNGFVRPSYILNMLQKAIGHSLLSLEGHEWRNMRQTMADVFTPDFVQRKVVSNINDVVSRQLSSWYDGDVINIEEQMRFIGIISKTVFSSDMTSGQAQNFMQAVDTIMRISEPGVHRYIPKALGLTRNVSFPPLSHAQKKAISDIDNIILPIIDRRLNLDSMAIQNDDLLARLIGAHHGEGLQPLSRAQIRDQILLFTVAGHETLAGVLTFAFNDILQQPDVLKKMRDDTHNYCARVMLEALRLHPPASFMLREASLSTQFNHASFEKGDLVLIDFESLHRDPDYWLDPEHFQPDRFQDIKTLRPHFIPFSRGPKVCIGRSMSMVEGTTVLREVIQNFDLKPQEFLKGKTSGMTKRPQGRLIASVRRR